MRWSGQVRAVFVKDLRQVWWMIGLLGAVMLMALLRVTVLQPAVNESFGWYDTLIPVLILWIMSAVVRADAPAMSTAFWSTQPLKTSAVVTAKLLQVVVIGALAISGAAVMLRWWGIGWADVPSTVVVTGIATVTIATAGALFAALSAHTRAVLLGAVVTIGAFFALSYFWPAWYLPLRGDWGRMAWLVVIVVNITALLRLYRLREVAFMWRVGGGVLVAATVLSAIVATQIAQYADTPRVAAPPLTLSVDPVPGTGNAFSVDLEGLVSSAHDIKIVDAILSIDLPDGSSVSLPVLASSVRFATAFSRRPENDGSATPQARPRTLRASSTSRTIEAWSRLRVPGARVRFDGTVVEFASEEQRRIPLVSAVLPVIRRGERQELRMVAGDSARMAVLTSRRFLDQRARTSSPASQIIFDLEFRLVERATGMVVGAIQHHTNGGSAMDALPGLSIIDLRAELRPPTRTLLSATDTSWWSTHDLVIMAAAPRRAYRVHAETVVGR